MSLCYDFFSTERRVLPANLIIWLLVSVWYCTGTRIRTYKEHYFFRKVKCANYSMNSYVFRDEVTLTLTLFWKRATHVSASKCGHVLKVDAEVYTRFGHAYTFSPAIWVRWLSNFCTKIRRKKWVCKRPFRNSHGNPTGFKPCAKVRNPYESEEAELFIAVLD